MLLTRVKYCKIPYNRNPVNEWSTQRLKSWYELAQSQSKHLVVLDLWSWLTPPSNSTGKPTIIALPTIVNTSFVSLDKTEQDTWRDLIPSYFNYSESLGYGKVGEYIPQECYDSRYMRSENETWQMGIRYAAWNASLS